MKRTKKIVAFVFVLATMISMLALPAFASTKNQYFYDFKATVLGYNAMSNANAKQKDTTSSIYLYYDTATYSSVRVKALGSTDSDGSWNNRTYYKGSVTYVTCAKGIYYNIHNQIRESGESYAKLAFHSTYVNPNYISGEWSPDSTESSKYVDAAP